MEESILKKILEKNSFLLEHFEEGIALYEEFYCQEGFDLAHAVENPTSGLWRKLKLLDCNKIFIEQTGLNRDKLLALDDVTQIMISAPNLVSKSQLENIWLNIANKKKHSGFFQWKRPDGKPNWIKYSAVPVPNEEKNYVLGLYTDITDKVIVHDKLQQFYTSQSRTMHDFKNPMAAIIGWARQIRHHPDQLNSGLMHIERSANRLLGLADAGLSMNEIFSDLMEIKPEWITIEDIEVMLDSLFASTIAKKGLRWMCDFPVERRLQIFADEFRLTQILQNLVQNSLQFTSTGEIKIHCLIDSPAPASGIDFVITDTGTGIAKENHQKIFKPYEKLARSTDGEFSYGLGLTTTKELVERMEGSITLESKPGVGTTFTVSFPKMEYRLAPSEKEEGKSIKGPEKKS